MNRVRAGSLYWFYPVMMDVIWSQHHDATPGQRVRVINLPSAPKANTWGQCHIEDSETGEFLGMVSIHSLERLER